MNISPFYRQLVVASGPQLASLSVGGTYSFPGILFEQLKANDTTIQLDVASTSWIGSTQGLAGAFGCLVPLFMQYKGRKIAFIISCLLGFIGWMIIYFAQDTAALIVAVGFHGLTVNGILTCSLSTISEMVNPRFRIVSMNTYMLCQAFGMNLLLFIGRHISWRTVALIECCPLILAVLICLAWPESPAWLAYKGRFDECEAAFKWLRGSDADSEKELNKLIKAHKEVLAERKATSFQLNRSCFNRLWLTIMQRDFLLPCFHTFILYFSIDWSGFTFVLMYTINMLHQVTSSESDASLGVSVIYLILLFGNTLGVIMLKKFKNKAVIVVGGTCAGFFMIAASVAAYLQDIKVLPQDSSICMYCLMCYTFSFTFGTIFCIMSVAAELMPIKHRGIGIAFCIVSVNLLDFFTLKVTPYLFLYIKPWGTFFVFGLNAILCMLFISRYIPETKNKPLQEIEEFYDHGHFVKKSLDNNALENMNDSNT